MEVLLLLSFSDGKMLIHKTGQFKLMPEIMWWKNMTQLSHLRKQWKSRDLAYFTCWYLQLTWRFIWGEKERIHFFANKWENLCTNPIICEQMFHCELSYLRINGELPSIKIRILNFIICLSLLSKTCYVICTHTNLNQQYSHHFCRTYWANRHLM